MEHNKCRPYALINETCVHGVLKDGTEMPWDVSLGRVGTVR